jgi:5,10-methylene-tetrahydrofolate dehydrogenase/methenyl tetrahydrofolate cyclohydrolase
VNRSEVVGRPLAALLANDGACVYSVDITGVQKFTRGEGLKHRRHEIVDMEGATLKDVAPLCDVVISGVPGDKYKFDTSLLREGAVCINFSSEKVGFVQYPILSLVVQYLTSFLRTSAPRSRRRLPSLFLLLAR